MLTDSHCHLNKKIINNVIKNAIKYNVKRIIVSSTNVEDLNDTLCLTKYDNIYATIGIHPEYASNATTTEINEIKKNISHEKVIAIGEIGLDYHYGKDNKEEQKILFCELLSLAEKINIPIVIHSREATDDVIKILKKYNVRGVIHSFNDTKEVALKYISMNFLLGINGIVTFKNSNLASVVKELPLTSLVLETDSPYLSPEPYRGKENEPARISDIASFIAQLKNISIEEIERVTNNNVNSMFNIKD